MDLGLNGRVAIVTGASQGIGFAAAELLVAEGARVVMAARDPGRLTEAAARLGDAAHPVALDVVNRTSSAILRDAAIRRFGRIDIVVNNAGAGGSSLDSFDEDEWVRLYETNVTSALRLTMACLADMRSRGWGRIVNVASTMARHCDPRFGPYGAAKAALVHLSRNLAQAYSGDGVLTNCVLPGLTRTDGVIAGYQAAGEALGRTPEAIEQRMMQRQPIAMGRTGRPDEVAAVIVFLCSQQASWVAGAEVNVDGGTLTDI